VSLGKSVSLGKILSDHRGDQRRNRAGDGGAHHQPMKLAYSGA
jgi:hypothetical protein